MPDSEQYSTTPGAIIGDTSRGPIRLQAGGSGDVEPTPQPIPVPAEPGTPAAPEARYTGDDLSRVRQQERDKLYTKLDKLATLEQQVAEMAAERDAARREQEQRQAEAEAAARVKAEEEMSVLDRLKAREQEWEDRFQQIETERAQERAFLEKEKALAELQAYIQRRVLEERENIAPQLLDLINGNSPEEVEDSIALMKAKSEAIFEDVTAAQTAMAANQRGVTATGYASAGGPLDDYSATKTYTPEELRSMPMSQYTQLRDKLLRANSSNSGLFS